MIVRNFAIKFLIFVLAILLISSCVNTQNSPPKIESESESKAAVILVTPTPFLGQRAGIQGENPPIKFAESFQDSIKQQEPPHVWLEFRQENEENLKVEFSDKINQELKSIWRVSLTYRNVKRNSKNPDELYDAVYNHGTTYVNSVNEIRELEIDSPDGKRKLTEDEIKEIIDVEIELTVDRYEELNEHFNSQT